MLPNHLELPPLPLHSGWEGTVRGDRARYTTPQEEPWILSQLSIVLTPMGRWTNVRQSPHACGRGDLEQQRAEVYDGTPSVQRMPGTQAGPGVYAPGDRVGPNDRQRPKPKDDIVPIPPWRRRTNPTTPDRPQRGPFTGDRGRPNPSGQAPGGPATGVPNPTTPNPGGRRWPDLPAWPSPPRPPQDMPGAPRRGNPTTGGPGRGTSPAGDNVPAANYNTTPWWRWFWPTRTPPALQRVSDSIDKDDETSDLSAWSPTGMNVAGTLSPFSTTPIQHGAAASVSLVQVGL